MSWSQNSETESLPVRSCYGMATRRPAAAQGAGLSNTITLETKALTVRIYARPQSVASARKSSLGKSRSTARDNSAEKAPGALHSPVDHHAGES